MLSGPFKLPELWPPAQAGDTPQDTAAAIVRRETQLDLPPVRFKFVCLASYLWQYRQQAPQGAAHVAELSGKFLPVIGCVCALLIAPTSIALVSYRHTASSIHLDLPRYLLVIRLLMLRD